MAKTATKNRSGKIEIVDVSLLLLGLDKIKQEANQSFSGDKALKEELSSQIDAILIEKDIKTAKEKVNDLALTLAKDPETKNNKEIGVIARRIELATEELMRQYPAETEEVRKEEFQKGFEKESKEKNPNLTEDQQKKVKEYGELVAKVYCTETVLDGQKDGALDANSQLFSPGKLENAWTDLRGMTNLLQKSPEEFAEIKEKYKSLKEDLKGVNLPNGSREARSFEKVMEGFNNPNIDQMFGKTRKYLGWADKIDKFTGGFLSRKTTEIGLQFVERIGNQAIQEFAKNALGQIASKGFEQAFVNIASGIMSGTGVSAVATGAAGTAAAGAAGTAAAGAATAAGTAAATAAGTAATAAGTTAAVVGGTALSATGVGAIVVAALAIGKKLKDFGDKIAEKLGISAKKFLEENFGKVGGKLIGGIAALVALPTILIGMVSMTVLLPIMILVPGGLFGYQMMQGNLVSTLLPPKGEEVANDQIGDDYNYGNINYTGSAKTVGSYTWNGITFYVFEGANGDNIKQVDRYDIGVIDQSWLEMVPTEYRKNCTYNGLSTCQLDKRIIPAYIGMIKAARESGELKGCQLNEDLKLNWGYRTKAEQDIIWGRNQDSARAAPPDSISEHRTGRGVDIRINCGIGGGEAFSSGYPIYKASSTFQWLLKNASKYGFYNYEREPWHWSYNPPMPATKTVPDSGAL